MIDKIINFILKHKKVFIIIGSCLLLLIIGLIVWKVYFSKLIEFREEEKLFTETVERFYSMNKNRLPKNGEIRELTLQDMYDGGHIDDLFMPGTRKMCDPDNSFVRVYNDNGKYKYYTYLECGKFKSKIDHVGPVITLNEKEQVVFSLNSTYTEYGVKEVKDNKDGNIDVNKVVIDSSKVNMNKLGIYPVTYTIYDSSHNKTVVTRNVVVAKNLTEEVRKSVSSDGYYKGSVDNNYILFSGMLFRIVNVDNEGNIKIVSQDNIANVNYGTSDTTYDNSNVNKWLNNYYYSNIHNTDYLKKDNKWCIDTIGDVDDMPSECSTYSNNYAVGLLSVYDYKKTFNNNSSFLKNFMIYMFSNTDGGNIVYTHYIYNDNNIYSAHYNELVGIKPVLVLKNNLFLVSGDGTFDNPYKLDDYYPASGGVLLNTRIVGEYVNYFGTSFRIAGTDKDGNTKLVSTYYLKNSTTGYSLAAKYDNVNYKFNPNEEGNIGYTLNNDFMDYIDDKYIISHDYEIPSLDSSKMYDGLTKSTVTAKVSIPASYEMFSGAISNASYPALYWLIDYVNDSTGLFINSSNGYSFQTSDSYNLLSFKISIYVNKDVLISSGDGTIDNPYIIK